MILLYHRVASLPTDPQLLAVSPGHFREHLEVIRRSFHAIPLRQVVNGVLDRTLAQNDIAITFDDGYADNAEIAAPILRGFDTPATVFVTMREEEPAREFWWDELERLILQTPNLPPRLQLRLNNSHHEWTPSGCDWGDTCDPSWNVLQDHSPTERQALYLHLCRLLRVTPDQRRRQILGDLRAWAGAAADGRSSHRAICLSELAGLADDGLIEVGAHSLTHPVLSTLPVAEQFAEIRGSRRRLEAILDREVTSFAYPFGCRGDFGPETIAMTKNAGFLCACANTGKPPHARARITPSCDIYALPRVIVRDWDGDTFARHLREAMCQPYHQSRPRHARAGA